MIGQKLAQKLQDVVDHKDESKIVTMVDAIGNAGPRIFPEGISRNVWDIKNPRIVAALKRSLRKFSTTHMPSVSGSDFPFNKSYVKDIVFGGEIVNAKFEGELFAGTNFDCKQEYFNYEALASATVTVNVFSISKQAFIAEAIYGKANGQSVGDELYISVWGDVLYDQPIPEVDCSTHTYEIAQTSPGFSVQYTLWVSVIPITFSASVSLVLDLDWGWQICDSTAYAMVEIIPGASLVIDGDAEIDLLIIKAGFDLGGSFNTQVVPQGYIDGSQCQVGFDVQRQSSPMNIALVSYYQWRYCEFWIFDCHWGTHHQQTWFSWYMPAVDETLFDQSWDI